MRRLMLSMSVSLDGFRGRFAHWLARHRLIDEYRLTVHPAALGEGLPLLHGLPEPLRLVLASSTVYTDGSVDQVYTPA